MSNNKNFFIDFIELQELLLLIKNLYLKNKYIFKNQNLK